MPVIDDRPHLTKISTNCRSRDPTNEQHLCQRSTSSSKPAVCSFGWGSTYHVDERASLDSPLLRTASSHPFILILAISIDNLCSQTSVSFLRAIRRHESYDRLNGMLSVTKERTDNSLGKQEFKDKNERANINPPFFCHKERHNAPAPHIPPSQSESP